MSRELLKQATDWVVDGPGKLKKAEAERDEALAQVAVLVGELTNRIVTLGIWSYDKPHWLCQRCSARCPETLGKESLKHEENCLLYNLPAAAKEMAEKARKYDNRRIVALSPAKSD